MKYIFPFKNHLLQVVPVKVKFACMEVKTDSEEPVFMSPKRRFSGSKADPAHKAKNTLGVGNIVVLKK